MVEYLKSIPLIAIDPKQSDTTQVASVVIPTAQAGVAASGVVYRMDHVPLRYKKVVESVYPTDREVLERIIAKVSALRREGLTGTGTA